MSVKSDRLELTLPYPPSVNSYWQHDRTGKTYISDNGKAFRKSVAESVLVTMRGKGFGKARVRVAIVAHPPDKRVRDLDNICKALLDALEHATVFENDAQVDHLEVKRGLPSRQQGGSVSVVVEVL